MSLYVTDVGRIQISMSGTSPQAGDPELYKSEGNRPAGRRAVPSLRSRLWMCWRLYAPATVKPLLGRTETWDYKLNTPLSTPDCIFQCCLSQPIETKQEDYLVPGPAAGTNVSPFLALNQGVRQPATQLLQGDMGVVHVFTAASSPEAMNCGRSGGQESWVSKPLLLIGKAANRMGDAG